MSDHHEVSNEDVEVCDWGHYGESDAVDEILHVLPTTRHSVRLIKRLLEDRQIHTTASSCAQLKHPLQRVVLRNLVQQKLGIFDEHRTNTKRGWVHNK